MRKIVVMKSFSAASLAAFLMSIVPVVSGATDKKVLVDRSSVGYIAGLRCAAKAGEIKTLKVSNIFFAQAQRGRQRYLLPWTGTPNAKAVHALEPR